MVQNKGRAIMVFALILLITTTTACERSLSQAPQATPTFNPNQCISDSITDLNGLC